MSKTTKLGKTETTINRKLTLSMFFSFLSFVVLLNMVGLGLLLHVQLLHIEKEVNAYQHQLVFDVNQPSINIPKEYDVEIKSSIDSSPILDWVFQSSSLESARYRKLTLTNGFLFSLSSPFKGLEYAVVIERNDQFVSFTYDLSNDMIRFWSVFKWVLLVEVFMVIVNAFKFSDTIKVSLHPLTRIATSTKNIQKDVSNLAVSANSKQLQSIADAIEQVDAHTLSHPLSVHSSQKDLQQVTQAINEMLERINQTVSSQTQFVSDASHELRTPIAVIQGYINLLDRWGKEDPATLQESIDAIKAQTESMKSLVEHLLFLARGDSDTIALTIEKVDASIIIEETINEMKFIDDQRVFDYEAKQPIELNVDKQLFKQALRILLDNAMKYSLSNTPIKIVCSKNEEYTIISITDQGVGIEAANMDRIFDRFYRDDTARSHQIKGSGLGLSIAKWIVERHGGYVEITSRKHIGTKVSLFFKKG